MNFFDISFLFSGHGFGLNTNILETNVINLAVVIGVVVSFVGDAVRELLKNRKQTILDNLREADNRALEAQEKLTEAKNQFELAQQKAKEIREQGLIAAEQDKNLAIKQAEEEAVRLEQVKQDTIELWPPQERGLVKHVPHGSAARSLTSTTRRTRSRQATKSKETGDLVLASVCFPDCTKSRTVSTRTGSAAAGRKVARLSPPSNLSKSGGLRGGSGLAGTLRVSPGGRRSHLLATKRTGQAPPRMASCRFWPCSSSVSRLAAPPRSRSAASAATAEPEVAEAATGPGSQ